MHVSRALATAAESTPTASEERPAPAAPERPQHKKPSVYNRRENDIVQTAVILNRSPILSRMPTRFESTYYAYHRRIQRALTNPLPTDFYFKPGSLLEGVFKKEENARERAAFGRPNLNREEEYKRKRREENQLLPGQEEPPKLMPRKSEADKTGDVKSLDRKGERNLYLLVQAKDEAGKDVWRFPQTDVSPKELLHDVSPCYLK